METFCTEPLLYEVSISPFAQKKTSPRKKKDTFKDKLPQYPSRNPRQTFNRAPIPIRRYCWKPPTYLLKKTTTEYLTTPVPESTRLIDCTNIYHNTSTICLDETCYVFTTVNGQINLEKGITQADPIIT